MLFTFHGEWLFLIFSAPGNLPLGVYVHQEYDMTHLPRPLDQAADNVLNRRDGKNYLSKELEYGRLDTSQCASLGITRGMKRATGLEPATSSLGSWHSTTELRPLSDFRFAQLRSLS